MSQPAASASVRRRCDERFSLLRLVRTAFLDGHGRLPLAAMREERRDLGVERVVDPLDVIDHLGLEQQQANGAVRLTQAGEEVGITCRDERVDRHRAGPMVIGMEAVLLPRIVTQHDVGSNAAQVLAHGSNLGSAPRQLAVDQVEEVHVADAERSRGVALLVVSGRDERPHVGVGVPGPLRAVSEDEQVHLGAGSGPARQRAGASELHVVRMGADRERALRRRDVDGRLTTGAVRFAHTCTGRSASVSRSRSSGTSTSKARSARRTTRRRGAHPAGLRGMATERPLAVREAERQRDRDGAHVRAVGTMTRDERDDRAVTVLGEGPERLRSGKVGVSDHAAHEAERPEMVAAGRGRGVEPAARVVDVIGTDLEGPAAHLGC